MCNVISSTTTATSYISDLLTLAEIDSAGPTSNFCDGNGLEDGSTYGQMEKIFFETESKADESADFEEGKESKVKSLRLNIISHSFKRCEYKFEDGCNSGKFHCYFSVGNNYEEDALDNMDNHEN